MSRRRDHDGALRRVETMAFIGPDSAAALVLPSTVGPVHRETATSSTPAQPRTAPRAASPDPDAELARRAAAGDALAFDAIVRGHAERVRAVAMRMLGNRTEAEDLAQEVFVAVYNAIPSFRGEARLSTWILRITRNHCLNRIKAFKRRRAGRERLQHDVESIGDWPGVSSTSAGPERQALSREVQQQVQRAIAELPVEQRWLVVLRDIEGLDYDEIATSTGLPLGTVKSRLHRARERLARSLAGSRSARRGSTR